ncbi:MAG: hypothetical protein ACYDAI_13995 [Trichloromonadaceae bacterium]
MHQPIFPAHCPSCGAVFESRLIRFVGNVNNIYTSGNMESCPFCGKMANTAEGIFAVADNVLSIISAPHLTKEILSKINDTVKKAYLENKSPEQLADAVEKIDPTTGAALRSVVKNKSLYLTTILLLLFALKSCSVNIDVDINTLVDQVKGINPDKIVSSEKP